MNFSIKYFFSKCDQIRSFLENFNGKIHFCAVISQVPSFSLLEIVTQKDCSAHINLDQIHHRRNNWLGPIFFLREIFTQKDCLSCFVQVLKESLWLKLILKGGLCTLRLLSLMTEFSVFIPLQGIAPGNSWLGGVFMKDYKII